MGWLALLIAYVVGPVLVLGLVDWILSGFPLPWVKPTKPAKRGGLMDNGFVLFLCGTLMVLSAIAYEIFVAHYVFQGIAFAMAKAFGAI